MKKILGCILFTFLVFSIYFYQRHPLGAKVIINGYTFNVEMAVTEFEKQKGLGGRDSLPANSGMLFIYQNKDRYGFWMKDMRFGLDYIWIEDNTVVDLSQHIPAPNVGERPVELVPRVPVNKVLEVNTGTIASYGIRIGDPVQFTD